MEQVFRMYVKLLILPECSLIAFLLLELVLVLLVLCRFTFAKLYMGLGEGGC